MKHIFHAHTNFCGHAKFTVKSLVQKAVDEGYETIGISEHAFSAHGTMLMALRSAQHAKEYVLEVMRQRQVFTNQIRVLCGFELEVVDFFTGEVPLNFNKELLNWKHVDYGIWAFHYYQFGQHVFTTKPDWKMLEFAYAAIEKAFASGLVTYLAHPDGFIEGNGRWDEKTAWLSERIIDLAVKHDVILAMNVNGYSHNKLYPAFEFWKMVAAKGAKMTIEIDAHSEGPFHRESIAAVHDFAHRLNLKPISQPFKIKG